MTDLTASLFDLRIDRTQWRFADVRIDIPPNSFGSDAINAHTQYSNPIAELRGEDAEGIGASFTLGAGNDMVCAAAEWIVDQLHGATVGELAASASGLHATMSNPSQMRWLSPNSGVPLMAAGLIINTLLDAAAKRVGLPAWEYLASLPTSTLLSLVDLRPLPSSIDPHRVHRVLEDGLPLAATRASELRATGIPVYFTTWIGHSAEQIADQMLRQREQRGVTRFKMKISRDIAADAEKLRKVRNLVPEDTWISVDANQTLNAAEAKAWLDLLSAEAFGWLEEPFAPDNIALFAELTAYKRERSLACEVVTGENCPNTYTAAALMQAGIDRFQADPCRMMGLADAVLVCVLGAITGCAITPHAGGSALDELSPHIQLFNLARVRTELPPAQSLTENVGFCSRYFAAPTQVADGTADVPREPGLLVGLEPAVQAVIADFKECTTWLAL
jgi:L-fuconate dehydratase